MSVNSKLPPYVKELISNTKIVIIITNNKFYIFINMENTDNSQIYDTLVSISNGEEYTLSELGSVDDLINGFKFNSKYPANSMIKLYFENYEDYWKLFDLSDNDIWFANAVYSHYDNFEFESSDWADDDWKQGYIIRGFGPENLAKVSDILKLIAPIYSKLEDDEYFEQASNLLETMFERQVDEIKWEYTSERNNCKNRGAVEMIVSETCEAFQPYGIFRKTCFISYFTTISTLLRLYKMVNDTSLTIYEVLEKIGKDISIGGNWYEYMYEVDCIDFDQESFDRNVDYQLEKIMDKLTDDEDFVDMKKFIDEVSPILAKYKVGTWYKTPKNPDLTFNIYNVDVKKQLLMVATQKPYSNQDRRSYSPEDFNVFLYQPELFEQKKFRKLK